MIFCDQTCQDVEIVKHFQDIKNIQEENIKTVMISESFPKEEHKDWGIVFIPSYTQTGDSFGIEKVKIEMVKEDVGKAMEIIKK